MTEDSTKIYLKQIHEIPLLSSEEEKHYAQLAAQGDTSARNKLIESNLRLVASIARNYSDKGSISFMDACQEGNLGLTKAVEKYDVSKGYKFSTYATYWIKQAIGRAIANQSRTIRTPVHISEALSTINKAETELTQKLGRQPTDKEIAEAIGIEENKVTFYKDSTKATLSLDVPIDDAEESDIADVLADPNIATPEDNLAQQEKHKTVAKVLGTLPDIEKNVLELRFGLNDGKPTTLEETGKRLGISKDRVRQLEERALRKLRNPLRANVLKDELTEF